MSFLKSKEDLDRKRRERQAKEAEEALGKIEIPILMDHNYDDLVAADAADAARAAARETKRAAERAAERAYAAEIAAEIPEAQKARKLLTEYWKKMNDYKAKHMTPDGLLIGYSIQEDRPNQNWQEVYDACKAAAAAYRAKYPKDSRDWREMELCQKKSLEYDRHSSRVFFTMRDYDREKGLYNLQRNSWMMSGGGKKTKYSRKSKSRSKYSRKSRSKYSRKSRSKYSRKY